MTLVAGILARRDGGVIDDGFAQQLLRNVSRSPGDHIAVHRTDRALLAKLDMGVFGSPGEVVDADGSVTLVTGEPILMGRDRAPAGRAEDVHALHHDLKEGRTAELRGARGVFSAVHFDPDARRLWLISDKLGIRPLYYWIDDDCVVFASALRILEALPQVPKKMDLRAVTEITTLGIPLAHRTPYLGVHRIGSAEVVRIDGVATSVECYWRWDEVAESKTPGRDVVRRLDERFRTAVRLRLDRARPAVTFLSGGMDSRAVAATLVAEGAQAFTLNFSVPGTQDHVFARHFAREIGTRHLHFGGDAPVLEEPRFSTLMAQVLSRLEKTEQTEARYPRAVWSGDGGSVGIGHVYMTRPVVELLRRGDAGGAVDLFLDQRGAHLHRRVFRPEIARFLSSIPARGILDELASIRSRDRGRAFHLFLMLNDQRRHLTPHFEAIDLHRIEFHLPFYDAEVLEAVLECPLDFCLFHRLYTRWFELLHPATTRVPWQTYPGHLPCPLPIPSDAAYQWDRSTFRALRGHRRQRLLRKAGRMLTGRDFPSPILARSQLLLAAVAYAARVRDCGYLLSTAETFTRYWEICRGEYAIQ